MMPRSGQAAAVSPAVSAAVSAEVSLIMGLVNQSIHELPDKVKLMQDTYAQGMQRAVLEPVSDAVLERVYENAYEAFQQQRYHEVLPLALYLAIQKPLDQRFLFMAGMTLQLLGDPLMAATFYAVSLQVDPTLVPAAFRLAECYASVGAQDDAREIFETVIDMGRGGDADEFYELQRYVMDSLRAQN